MSPFVVFLSLIFYLSISGTVFGAKLLQERIEAPIAQLSESDFDNFAQYVLETFENFHSFLGNDPKYYKSSSKASGFENAHPKSFPISLFLDMEIFIGDDAITLRKLLKMHGDHIIIPLALYQKHCCFINELVARMRKIAIRLVSSEHLTRYHLIKRLPRFFQSSILAQNTLGNLGDFILLVKLHLKFALVKDVIGDFGDLFKISGNLGIFEKVVDYYVPVKTTFDHKLRLFAYSKKEINFGKKIIILIHRGSPLKNPESSGIKELDEAFTKNNGCILKTFSCGNVFVRRIVNFIRLHGIYPNSIDSFLGRIHQLKGLDSEVFDILFQYVTKVLYNQIDHLNVIFGLPYNQLRILYEFLGLDNQIKSCTSITHFLRNSLFKLGMGKNEEMPYDIAKLMFSFFLLKEKYEYSVIDFTSFFINHRKEEYLEGVSILKEKVDEHLYLSVFMFSNDNNVFSVFANGIIFNSPIDHGRLMYFFSSFIESHLGITTDTMFMLDRVKCPFTNWLFFMKLIRTHKSQKVDFSYIYELFEINEKVELENDQLAVIQTEKDFKSWCELFFRIIRKYVDFSYFLNILSYRSKKLFDTKSILNKN